MRKLGFLALVFLLCGIRTSAQFQRAFGWCEVGGQNVTVQGLTQSSPPAVQASYSACTITVYIHGTLTLATIFQDSGGVTPLANPFSAQTNAYWFFYAANGRYDVQESGAGISPPFSYADILLGGTGGGGGGGIGGSGTTNSIAIFNSATTITSSPCSIVAPLSVLQCPGFASLPGGGYSIEIPNSASGTTQGLSVSYDANHNAITTPNGAVAGSQGVCISGCGTTGTALVLQLGQGIATFDNQTVTNDYIVLGANGQLHDSGVQPPNPPTGVQVLGQVVTANSGAGTTATASIFTGDIVGNSKGTGGAGTLIAVNGTTVAGTTGNFNATAPAVDSGFVALNWKTDNATPTSSIIAEVSQATATAFGVLKLQQDLGGTAALPKVVGIQGVPVTFTSINTGDTICFTSISSLNNCSIGVAVRQVPGATDTIVCSTPPSRGDRANWVIYTNAGNVAVTLPQANSAGCGSNFPFNAINNGTGNVTITPTTSTITKNGSGATAGSSLVIAAGSGCLITSDNTNYFADCSGAVPAVPCTGTGAANLVCATAVNQALANVSQSGSTGCASCTALSIVPSASVGSAHLLIVAANINTGNSPSLTDTNGNTWTLSGLSSITPVWYTCSAIGGSDTINLSWISNQSVNMHFVELNGNATASCLDQTGVVGISGSGPFSVSTTGSVAQGSEAVIGIFSAFFNVAGFLPGSSYTAIQNTGASNTQQITEILNTDTGLAGVQTATAKLAGGTSTSAPAQILTFKLTSAGIGPASLRHLVFPDLPSAVTTPGTNYAPTQFSNLTACGSTVEGEFAPVIDSTTNAIGATITGGGSFHVFAYCNGTNWTVAAGGTAGSGVGAPGMVLLEEHTASSSASLNFTTCISPSYDEYKIEIVQLTAATNNVSTQIQFSTNGGSSYDTTAAHYAWNEFPINITLTPSPSGSDSAAALILANVSTPSSGTSANASMSGDYTLYRPGGAIFKQLTGLTTLFFSTDSHYYTFVNSGQYLQTTAVNAFQVIESSGNISAGTVRCYGIVQ